MDKYNEIAVVMTLLCYLQRTIFKYQKMDGSVLIDLCFVIGFTVKAE